MTDKEYDFLSKFSVSGRYKNFAIRSDDDLEAYRNLLDAGHIQESSDTLLTVTQSGKDLLMERDKKVAEFYEKIEENLKNRLSDKFLDDLVFAARSTGWSNDYIEIESFVRSLFDLHGKEAPDLTPFAKECP